jgi:DNA (cytosine-5)-methyltransferase 1
VGRRRVPMYLPTGPAVMVTGPAIGSLFTGYGGLDMGVRSVLGGHLAWHCDNAPGPARILAHRWPEVPNLGDIRAVNWTTAPPVDVLTGGFPCQDVSHAAAGRIGLHPGRRSGLWSSMAYAIHQLRPALVVAENVRGLLSADATSHLEPCPWCVGDDGTSALRALGAVLGDLADIGYDAEWCGVPASAAGAPHQRFRVFIYAWPTHPEGSPRRRWRTGLQPQGPDDDGRRALTSGRHPVADPDDSGRGEHRRPGTVRPGHPPVERVGRPAWGPYADAITRWENLTRPAPPPTEAGRGGPRLSPRFVEWMMGLPDGHVTAVPGLTHNQQLTALGNGVVPQQAALATQKWAATELDAA